MKNIQGFTLIELMIVIAIMAILATMTIPSSQDRIIRAQVQQAVDITSVVQEEIEDFYKIHQRLPQDNTEIGLPVAEKFVGNYVKALHVKQGAIQVTLGNKVNVNILDKTITIRPAIVADAPIVPIAWVCGNASQPEGMEIKGENVTTLLSEHLPLLCR